MFTIDLRLQKSHSEFKKLPLLPIEVVFEHDNFSIGSSKTVSWSVLWSVKDDITTSIAL